MRIRPATPEDAIPLAELLGHLGYPCDPKAVPRRLQTVLESGGALLLACTASDEPVGLIGLHAFPVIHSPGLAGYITALVVAPTAQGQGVGRALLAAAEAWARGRGCRRLTVTSAEHREGAHVFYPRMGFPYTGRRYSRQLD